MPCKIPTHNKTLGRERWDLLEKFVVRNGKLLPDFVAYVVYFLSYREEVVCSFGQAEALEAIRLSEWVCVSIHSV